MPVHRTRRNPIGSPIPKDIQLVRVGAGEHSHVWHPRRHGVICNSGKNAGRVAAEGEDNRGKPQNYFLSDANFVTCYRCQKLMELNLLEGRPGWMSPAEEMR